VYSGIVQGAFPVRHVTRREGALSYAVELPPLLLRDIARGYSVSIDGVCQTVANLEGSLVWFDAHQETLRVTTLGELTPGSLVHVERSLKVNEENGGHAVSGHIDGTVEVVDVASTPHNHTLTLLVEPAFAKYIFNKGFVALHGASLTVGAWNESARTFSVYLIPETLRLTTFAQKRVGARLNLEIDRQTQVLVDTIERSLRSVLGRLGGELEGVRARAGNA
jgi:riboflavin synthase